MVAASDRERVLPEPPTPSWMPAPPFQIEPGPLTTALLLLLEGFRPKIAEAELTRPLRIIRSWLAAPEDPTYSVPRLSQSESVPVTRAVLLLPPKVLPMTPELSSSNPPLVTMSQFDDPVLPRILVPPALV